MKHWFDALPIHRKLVAMALAVTTTALLAATVGLLLLDVWRYRHEAADDAASLAQVIAENIGAAVVFEDTDITRETLSTVRVRPVVARACVYLPDGTLFVGFARGGTGSCPARVLPASEGWRSVSSAAPIVRNGKTVGSVYVERDLSDLGARLAVTAGAGAAMLVLAAALAFALASRLHRTVSTPIRQLANAARMLGAEPAGPVPSIEAPPDEVGALVQAFSGMMQRVQDANEGLRGSNDALRREVHERTRIQAEREMLLSREREASRLKDEFLAAVSHELRTPLNAIIGWVQILTSTDPTQQTTAKALASIARNAQSQTRVIEDLVDVSRIVTGKLHLRLDPVDLRAPIDGAIEAIGPSAHAKNIAVMVKQPAAACFINGDHDRLQQVIWNLLSNAVKFTPAGGAVSVTLEADGLAYQILVTDTGIGIAGEFLPHAFERFRQADGSMTREHGGLGLGLAIVKELTELHGGSVAMHSEGRGRGTSVSVRLPALADFREGLDVHRGASGKMAAGSLSGVSVLAVDDSLDTLDIVSAALTHAGAVVRVAATGIDAVQAWDAEPADVLVCDLAMPQMDGLEVLRRIREQDTRAGRTTHAVAVTAHASDDYRARALAAGFEHHLAKPYDAADLVRVVAEAVVRS